MKQGKKILYAKAKKAIYGTVRAAHLFWLELNSSMKKWGFTQNSYSRCTMNQMFRKDQCTIQWHIHDLKISYRNKAVVESILAN